MTDHETRHAANAMDRALYAAVDGRVGWRSVVSFACQFWGPVPVRDLVEDLVPACPVDQAPYRTIISISLVDPVERLG